MERMIDYAQSGLCRWRLILEHFDDSGATARRRPIKPMAGACFSQDSGHRQVQLRKNAPLLSRVIATSC
jgi:hypothetical protein